MFNLGFGEILIICAVLIIVVGPERLPSLMKTVGKTLRTVRQASRDLQATVGLDELLREDITRPLPPPRPRIPPAATVPAAAVPALPADNVAPQATSELSPAVSPVLPSSTDDGSPAPEASPPLAAEQLSPSGEQYNKKSEQLPGGPTLAEADGMSISERMLLLHTPPQTQADDARADADHGDRPARAAGTAAGPGGGKGEA